MTNLSHNQSNVERIVMRRVRTVRVLRPIVSTGTVSAVISIIALWGIGREVWVAKVFANGPHDFTGHLTYLGYAFEHTKFLVQALTALAGVSIVYFVQATVRGFSSVSLNRFASS